MISVTQHLARFIFEFSYEELPNELVQCIKNCVIDSVGATLGGSQFEDVAGIIQSLKGIDDQEQVHIWSHHTKTSLLSGVLINGTMGHAVEMDDVHKIAKVHAGAVVVPTALTVGEYFNSTGREVMEAVLCGYEVMIRLGIGIGAKSHRMLGWHATSTCGTFGAAATAAKLMNLNYEQVVDALGMAGTQSSGLWAFTEDGASSKKFHSGMAAHAGVLAVLLAKGGMTGPGWIIEAEDGGLFRAMSKDYDYAKVIKGLGQSYEILNVDKKPYPCCRSMHPSITAILMFEIDDFEVDKIDRIIVNTYTIAIKQCYFSKKPKSIQEAKFSIPYGVALSMIYGHDLVHHFTQKSIENEQVLKLAEKVEVEASKEFDDLYPDQWGCEVEIHYSDQRVLRRKIYHAKGDTKNPLTKEELKAKFYSLSGHSKQQKEKIFQMMQQLEKIEAIRELTSQL